MVVRFDGGRLYTNVKQIDKRTKAFIYAACGLHSRRAQAYARKNAPWTDRTSNARNGLISHHFKNGNTFGVIVAGTVSYQIWLEIRWSGRYAIIRPTINHTGPALMATIAQGWGRVIGGG